MILFDFALVSGFGLIRCRFGLGSNLYWVGFGCLLFGFGLGACAVVRGLNGLGNWNWWLLTYDGYFAYLLIDLMVVLVISLFLVVITLGL